MKNLYTLITLALCGGLMATAQELPEIKKDNSLGMSQTLIAANPIVKKAQPQTKAAMPAREASSLSDLFGPYLAGYQPGLENGAWSPFPVEIVEGEEENQIVAQGIFYDSQMLSFPMTVDLATQTVTVKRQVLFFDDNYGVEISIELYKLPNLTPIQEATGEILEDGTIQFPNDINIALSGSYLGYPWAAINLSFVPYFNPDLNNWESVGTASFKDCWVLPFFGEDVYNDTPAVAVEIIKNKNNPGEYALVNPYEAEPYKTILTESLNAQFTTGYIHFNCENPDYVYVYPAAGSGAIINVNDEANPYMQELFDWNQEGWWIFLGFEPDVCIDFMIENGYNISFLDPDNNTAYIYNTFFGFYEDPTYPGSWSTETWRDPNTILFAEINFNYEAGVDSMLNDFNENAPVKYYNIQGQEIINPAKGQIVIKKQGSKATKYIAR